MVCKPGENLAGHWADYGSKCFLVWGRKDRADKLSAAKMWASDKFGIVEWARDPFGSYGEAAYVKEHVKFLLGLLPRTEAPDGD